MADPYKLAFTLHGHSSDVRNLAVPNTEVPLLLSASRDGSAIVWGPSSSGGSEWDAKLRVEELERKYVSCVTMVNYQGQGECDTQRGSGALTDDYSVPRDGLADRHAFDVCHAIAQLGPTSARRTYAEPAAHSDRAQPEHLLHRRQRRRPDCDRLVGQDCYCLEGLQEGG